MQNVSKKKLSWAKVAALPTLALVAAQSNAIDLSPATTAVEALEPQATALFGAVIGVLVLVVGYRLAKRLLS